MEQNRKAGQVIEENLEAAKVTSRASVLIQRVEAFLKRAAASGAGAL